MEAPIFDRQAGGGDNGLSGPDISQLVGGSEIPPPQNKHSKN